MAYFVEVHERVPGQLTAQCGLTQNEADDLLAVIVGLLAEHGDVYRQVASARVAHESYSLWVDLVWRDHAGRFRHFWFVANDEHVAFGVLRLLYAEER